MSSIIAPERTLLGRPNRRLAARAYILALVLALLPINSPAMASEPGQLALRAEITSTNPALCERELGISVPFRLPLLDSFVDFVFIQDASGSFRDTMPQVKATLKQMVGELELGSESNGYPRDRAMLVTFQGSEGFGVTFDVSQDRLHFDYQGASFGYKITSTPLTGDQAVLNAAIDAISTLGATPTIDGMVRAQAAYTQALAPALNPYDRTYYLSNGEPRTRQTVYFLITDGVANSGLYDNFPAGYKPVDQVPPGTSGTPSVPNALRAWTWVYESQGQYYFRQYWDPSESQPSGFYYNVGAEQKEFHTFVDGLNIRYYLMDPNGPYPSDPYVGPFFFYVTGGAGIPVFESVTFDPWEDYERMLLATKAKAAEMKAAGGLPSSAAEATGPAWFVSAYWDDVNRFISAKRRGITYMDEMRPQIRLDMTTMATDENWFVSNDEGEGIAAFQAGLTEAFHSVLTAQLLGSLKIGLDSRVTAVAGSPVLRRQDAGGVMTEIPLQDRLVSGKGGLSVNLDGLPEGQYEFGFQLTEDAYIGEDYAPVSLVRLSQYATDGQGTSLENSLAKGTVPKIAANPNADCAPMALTVPLAFTKRLSGGTLKAGDFTFTLRDGAGRVLASASNAADGAVTFPPRTFSNPGTYLYTIEEERGGNKDVLYDKTRYTASVTVSLSASGLAARVDYLKDGTPYGGALVFENRLSPPETGDTALTWVLFAAAGALLAGSLAFFFRRRGKRGKKPE